MLFLVWSSLAVSRIPVKVLTRTRESRTFQLWPWSRSNKRPPIRTPMLRATVSITRFGCVSTASLSALLVESPGMRQAFCRLHALQVFRFGLACPFLMRVVPPVRGEPTTLPIGVHNLPHLLPYFLPRQIGVEFPQVQGKGNGIHAPPLWPVCLVGHSQVREFVDRSLLHVEDVSTRPYPYVSLARPGESDVRAGFLLDLTGQRVRHLTLVYRDLYDTERLEVSFATKAVPVSLVYPMPHSLEFVDRDIGQIVFVGRHIFTSLAYSPAHIPSRMWAGG